MRLLFIRHGEPNYEKDCLLESGKREAEALAAAIKKYNIDHIYCSPLGRAKETCAIASADLGLPVSYMDWLQEFPARVDIGQAPNDLANAYDEIDIENGKCIPWDMKPTYIGKHPEYMDPIDWKNSELIPCSDMMEKYADAINGIDRLLSDHGYEKDQSYTGEPVYLAKDSNKDTIAIFCHFGVTCVLLSHLLNISPFALWHGTISLASSVTELVTEEREKGIAKWRMLRFGDTSHLDLAGVNPAFAGRFAETFDSPERH
ncbi:MAG: histidine phosphatase family protein [Pseudobutyrivibrio sp.]|nr:histidine phosphatase family protein [Pseudobutyrivibrio sp.]